MSTTTYVEEYVEVAGTKTQLHKGGSGDPLLVLHGSGGNPGWMPYHEALSQHFTVYAPSLPGYDKSDRPSWVRTIKDIAHFYLGFMDTLGLDRVSVLGISMGGWLAAEIAAMCPHKLKGIVLVDAVGIKPQEGEIAEILMVSPEQTRQLAYYDISKAPSRNDLSEEEENALWGNREMASRLCWKPYMHNPNLPEYLKLVRVPALIIWGRQDRVVPLNCGEIYRQVLQGSILHVMDECGHSPQAEKQEEFLEVTLDFLSKL